MPALTVLALVAPLLAARTDDTIAASELPSRGGSTQGALGFQAVAKTMLAGNLARELAVAAPHGATPLTLSVAASLGHKYMESTTKGPETSTGPDKRVK